MSELKNTFDKLQRPTPDDLRKAAEANVAKLAAPIFEGLAEINMRLARIEGGADRIAHQQDYMKGFRQ
jgi:hypothetical protein